MQPISLDTLFKQKIFRIPDYQRGYAWQHQQYKDFWEDLVNLHNDRSHYTGVVTMKEISISNIQDTCEEYWLIDEHSYKMYDVIDGQQRLTTCVIFIQSLIDFIKNLEINKGKNKNEIYLTDTLTINDVIAKYLYKQIPTGTHFKTYKFGYNSDNPSYQYMKYKILGEQDQGIIDETFYTLNLGKAKDFFYTQIKGLYSIEGLKGIQDIYKKLTKNFLFNEYIIQDEFDVFVAFETMNNRGKNLSKLELLKNRLIYLTTLFGQNELDPASRNSLRNTINDSWKEVYYQLGRNKIKPLNDDDFLKAHWILSFQYTRAESDAYIKDLLDEKFSPKRLYTKFENDAISIIDTNDNFTDSDLDLEKDDISFYDINSSNEKTLNIRLSIYDIHSYVTSLKSFALHWFNSYYPYSANELSDIEKEWIDKLNRIGIIYFRPLVVSIMKNIPNVEQRIELFKRIERFIFISTKLSRALSNYGDTEFYKAARELDKNEIGYNDILLKIDTKENFNFTDGKKNYKVKYFQDYMYKKFTIGNKGGYYNWNGLQYLLYEYELERMKLSGQKKVEWDLFIKHNKDKVSIEHILPQTPTDYWKLSFPEITDENKYYYNGSLGNLLLLSSSINSSLQNDSYEEKVNPKYNQLGEKIRMGYSDGSHSEIEVSYLYKKWDKESIRNRGLKLLSFIEKRWDIDIGDEGKENLLFL